MPRLLHQPPKYWFHKKTGQAAVTVNGRRVYLGKFGTPKSHERYEAEVAKWRKSLLVQAIKSVSENQVQTAKPKVTAESLRERREAGIPISINELVLVYREYARSYYRKDGDITREAEQIGEALIFLRKYHGRLVADKFGPVLLKDLREKMIVELDWSRKHLNKQVGRIVRMFKWAVENELSSPEVHAALDALSGLKKGRTTARETEGVSCVDDKIVDRTIEHLPELVADMVRLQRLTSARPGEICSIKPGEIDRSEEVWGYSPSAHKTIHCNKDRLIMIGPQAQAILRPYLLRPADAFCFTPEESERRRYEKLAAERTTPLRKQDFERRKKRALRIYAESYTSDTYRHAVQRTCKRQGIPKWSPNQIRHTAATQIRKRYGIEASQVVCGHQTADVTQVYAERDLELARKVARELG